MVFITAGEFMMGTPDRKIDALVKQYNNDSFKAEGPQRKVSLNGYYVYRTPVTVGQYLRFCDETGYARPSAPDFNPNWSMLDHPIVKVTYANALAYCEWAGVMLPTEAQWEKAARGTDQRTYPWGSGYDHSKLCCSTRNLGDVGGTSAVGNYPSGASPFGLLDMAGNVFEWCRDWYDGRFYSSRLAMERNPDNQSIGEKKHRVVRGGSWDYFNSYVFRSAGRGGSSPAHCYHDVGFRCALEQGKHV